MRKIKPTTIIVGVFVILLIALFSAEKVNAHDIPGNHAVSLGLGGGVANYPGGVTQKLGYTYDGKWTAEYERFGGKGYDTVSGFSVVRSVGPGTNGSGFVLSFGASYFDGTLEDRGRESKAIVSDTITYRLGIDYAWRLSSYTDVRFGVHHNSTAGRSERNRGIDRLHLTFNWRV